MQANKIIEEELTIDDNKFPFGFFNSNVRYFHYILSLRKTNKGLLGRSTYANYFVGKPVF